MLARPIQRPAVRRQGSALLASLVTVMTLTGAAVALLTISTATSKRTGSTVARARALQLAEAGIDEALAQTSTAVDAALDPVGPLGTPAAPRRKGTGRYWASVTDEGGDQYRVISTGRHGVVQRRVEAVVAPRAGVFSYAIFAGNSSEDPGYAVELGGTGAQADFIDGDLYSGGNVSLSGAASVGGTTEARGTIVGGPGNEDVTRSLPDIAGQDYAATADVNVAALFSGATPGTFGASGTALQVPESNPAHIFRLNPDDRASVTSATAKDDYFLEDPYQPVSDFTLRGSGDPGHTITLSGILGAPGASGTDAVYYIDGNLWLNNFEFLGARLASDAIEAARVTFVARGNIYFSDDFELTNAATDGVAFIAAIDPAVPDSGNIYFGDSTFATINHMEAFMYAENDFFDNNLQGTASAQVRVTGTMAAGNQVNIDSDWVDSSGTPQHTRLEVVGDDRLETGALVLPGIPGYGAGELGYELVYWRELSAR